METLVNLALLCAPFGLLLTLIVAMKWGLQLFSIAVGDIGGAGCCGCGCCDRCRLRRYAAYDYQRRHR